MVILYRSRFLGSLGGVEGHLTLQIVEQRSVAVLVLEQAPRVVGAQKAFLLLVELLDFFLDLGLNFAFHLVQQLQLVFRQLADLIYFFLSHSVRTFHVRLKFLYDYLDSLLLEILFHEELLRFDLGGIDLVLQLGVLNLQALNPLLQRLQLQLHLVLLPKLVRMA